jgi:hypothetical protein
MPRRKTSKPVKAKKRKTSEASVVKVVNNKLQKEKKDPYREKTVAAPFSTGGGGVNFENRIQASFVVLMLTGGFSPCLPSWPVTSVRVQGKHLGFNVDDFIVTATNSSEKAKLLGQIKHEITLTDNSTFAEVIAAGWRDFNNTELFDKELDKIALVTGPMKGTDLEIREVLDWARNNNETDFFKQVKLANFSNDNKRTKLAVIREHLDKTAGAKLSDYQVWSFLKSFYLLSFDLDFKEGVNVSLLRSLIAQYAPDKANGIWAELIQEVQDKNQSAGEITIDTLPVDIVEAFKVLERKSMPASIKSKLKPVSTSNWNTTANLIAYCQALLVGKWNESSNEDVALIEGITKENYQVWIQKLHEIRLADPEIFSYKNKVWKLNSRVEQIIKFATVFLDEHISAFVVASKLVLAEIDPKFDLKVDQQYASAIYGKSLKYSEQLRSGLAEGLALIVNNEDELSSCSAQYIKGQVNSCISELLTNASWQAWASLNSYLTELSEASPSEFMFAIEVLAGSEALIELYNQEGDGFYGGNHLTGVYWSLEGLAWDDEFLVRVVDLFGQLDSKDPGGRWANRPLNSLTDIFLPWLPHNLSPLSRQLVAIKALIRNNRKTAFNLLIRLLPNQTQNSTGTHKPKWRKIIPDTWEKGVSDEMFFMVSFEFSKLLIDSYGRDLEVIPELVKHLDHLMPDVLSEFIATLNEILPGQTDEINRPVWEEINFLIARHRNFSEADWALDEAKIVAIECVAKAIEPKSLIEKGKRLFGSRSYDLFEDIGDWEAQQTKLWQERETLVKALYDQSGLEGILEFCMLVDNAGNLGATFSKIVPDDELINIFPNCCCSEGNLKYFVNQLAVRLYFDNPEKSLGLIESDKWNELQVSDYLKSLPFTENVWATANKLLDDTSLYWRDVSIRPLHKQDLIKAATSLLDNKRPLAALDVLYMLRREENKLSADLVLNALKGSLNTTEPIGALVTHQIKDFMKFLYESDGINMDDLYQIEWAYLTLFTKRDGIKPKALQLKLETEPDFFCELLSYIYKRDLEQADQVKPGAKEDPKVDENISRQVWKFIHYWSVGSKFAGREFSEENFQRWVAESLDKSKRMGRYDVAQLIIGEALYSAPADVDGLWINKVIAEVLNKSGMDLMRKGFALGLRNSRGVHAVDFSGEQDRNIAKGYKEKAEALEAEGFVKLATTIRAIATSYEEDAVHVADRFNRDEVAH